MFRIPFTILCFWILSACSSTPKPSITFCVEGAVDTVDLALQMEDSTYIVKLDSTFTGKLDISGLQQPRYATLKYVDVEFPIYVEPGKSLDVLLKIDPKQLTSKWMKYGVTPYFSGEGAAKNDYLNSEKFRLYHFNYKDSLSAIIDHQVEDYEQELMARLDSMKFDEPFVNTERKRIRLWAFRSVLSIWVELKKTVLDQQHIDHYYELLNAAMVEDEVLMYLPFYKSFMAEGIEKLVINGDIQLERIEALRRKLDYVQNRLTIPYLQEYLINYYLTEYVSYAGTEFLDEFMPLYEKKVIDSKKREKFYALCDTWRKIEPGAPSPTFAYTDINGKKVTLEDFGGKYVYIDVWATWCGPCCGEIPHLKELEHHFAKKNIAFVSISCDRDKSAWEKMVKKEKLGGIQLHNGGDRTFMNDYMVKGIPRFILLDREGKIINSRMTRPSNPETTQFIETLEGL